MDNPWLKKRQYLLNDNNTRLWENENKEKERKKEEKIIQDSDDLFGSVYGQNDIFSKIDGFSTIKTYNGYQDYPQLMDPKKFRHHIIIPQLNKDNTLRKTTRNISTQKNQTKKVSEEPEIKHNEVSTIYQKVKDSCIPLYFFDDSSFESLDESIIKEKIRNNQLFGFSPYCYRRDLLVWRECQVIDYDPPLYKIKWKDSEIIKRVYRISLRFDCEKEQTFMERRDSAFHNRKLLEQDLKFDTLINLLAAKSPTIPVSDFFSSVLSKLPVNISSDFRLQSVLQDIIQDYSIVHAKIQYENDIDNHKKATINSEFCIPLKSTKLESYMQKISKEKISLLDLPNMFFVGKIHRVLIEIIESEMNFNITNQKPELFFQEIYEYIDFYCSNIAKKYWDSLRIVVNNLLLCRPHDEEDRLFKMVSFRIFDCFCDIGNIFLDNLFNILFKKKPLFDFDISWNFNMSNLSVDKLIDTGSYSIEKSIQSICNLFNSINLSGVHSTNKLVFSHDNFLEKYFSLMEQWRGFLIENIDEISEKISIINDSLNPLPFHQINCINDIASNFSIPEDINHIFLLMKRIQEAVDSFYLQNSSMFICNSFVIHLDNAISFMTEQQLNIRKVLTNCIDTYITNIYTIIKSYLFSLFKHVNGKPNSIEEWFDQKKLIEDSDITFCEHCKNLDTVYNIMCNYQTYYSFDHFIQYFTLRFSLYEYVSHIPIIEKNSVDEYNRLIEDHKKNKADVNNKIIYLSQKVNEFHIKNDQNYHDIYLNDLRLLLNECINIQNEAQHIRNRDVCLNVEIFEFDKIQSLEFSINLFITIWTISHKVVSQVENWKSQLFLSLNPNTIIDTVQSWKSEIRSVFSYLQDLPNFYVNNVLIEKGSHPLLLVSIGLFNSIEDIISHIPIIQHLCNPFFRNRHWEQISTITGYRINQNEGLTWNWIIESCIEEKLSLIRKISHRATNEHKVEKALSQLTEEVRSISFTIKGKGSSLRIEDYGNAFQLLSEHQSQMNLVFVPPYNQPFITKIAEYKMLVENLKRILEQSIYAQNEIEKIASTVESEDNSKRKIQISHKYNHSLYMFNSFIEGFSNPQKLYDIVSNPKYSIMIDNVKDKLANVKNDISVLLKEKRLNFPLFCFLSDSQLIYMMSSSKYPESIKYMISLMYPNIREATFVDNSRCVGFISKNESVRFLVPFENTPDSIETMMNNFDEQLNYTLRTLTFKLYKKGIQNYFKQIGSIPTQVTSLVQELNFDYYLNRIMGEPNLVSNIKDLRNNIVSDLLFVSELSQCNPQIHYYNIVSKLIRHRDILNELINQSTSMSIVDFMSQRIYYSCFSSTSSQSVSLVINGKHYPYSFKYSGSESHLFITKQLEKLYITKFHSLFSNRPVVFHTNNENNTSWIINDFCRLLGVSNFTYSCSLSTDVRFVSSYLKNIQETGSILVLNGIDRLSNDCVSVILKLLYSESQNRLNMMTPIISTVTCHKNYQLPNFLTLALRPICFLEFSIKKMIESCLIVLHIKNHQELLSILIYLSEHYSKDPFKKFSKIFSPYNIITTLLSLLSLSEFPKADIFNAFLSQIKNIDNNDTDIREELASIFGVDCNVNYERTSTSDKIANETQLESLLLLLRNNCRVLIIGVNDSGKSTLIHEASRIFSADIHYIFPYSQPVNYLNCDFEQSVLYSSLSKSSLNKWIVFDGPIEDRFIFSNYITPNEKIKVFMPTGNTFYVDQSCKFLYETDDISKASPSLIVQSGVLNVFCTIITTQSIIDRFINDFFNDERISEPLSNRIIGTAISIDNAKFSFIDKLNSFISGFVVFASEFIDTLNNHFVRSFLYIFKALLFSYYIEDEGLDFSIKISLSSLLDYIDGFLVFSGIWSVASLISFEKKGYFEIKIKEIYLNKYQMTHSIYDCYYFPLTDEWKKWDSPCNLIETGINYDEIISSSEIISFNFLFQSLINCGINVIINTQEQFYSNMLFNQMFNSKFFNENFSIFRKKIAQENNIRDLIDEINGVSSYNSRIVYKNPALVLNPFKLDFCQDSELIRFIIDKNSYFCTKTMSNQIISSILFIIVEMNDSSKKNERLTKSFLQIKLDLVSNKRKLDIITNSLMPYVNTEHLENISNIVFSSINQLYEPFKMDFYHLYHMFSRVCRVMKDKPNSFLPSAIFYEFYSIHPLCEIVENGMSELLIMTNSLNQILGGTESWSNYQSKILMDISNNGCFQIVSSISDLSINAKGILIDKSKVHGFPNNIYEERLILLFARIIECKNSHVNIIYESDEYIIDFLHSFSSLFSCVIHLYDESTSLICSIKDILIQATRSNNHQIFVMNEESLTDAQKDYIYQIISLNSIEYLFNDIDITNILTENHDSGSILGVPEEHINDNSQYHGLRNSFIEMSRTKLHIVIISSPNEKGMKQLQKVMLSLVIQPSIDQYTDSCIINEGMKYIIHQICNEKEFNFLNVYNNFCFAYQDLYSIINGELAQEYERLMKLCSIIASAKHTLNDKTTILIEMEKSMENYNHDIDLLMKRISEEKEKTQENKLFFEIEEEELRNNETQAEILLRESLISLENLKPSLSASTQELNNVSNRDLSEIKTMNHPPKGVFLVLKALLVLFGIPIEDKTEEITGQQPSFIAGKKLLSDTSFMSNLLKRAMEGLPDNILDSLRLFIADPNFDPDIVANSSSAAKSICIFIRTIVPYYDALKKQKEKQQELKVLTKVLDTIREKHKISMSNLLDSNQRIKDLQDRCNEIQQKKENDMSIITQRREEIGLFENQLNIFHDYFMFSDKLYNQIKVELTHLSDKVAYLALLLAVSSCYPTISMDSLCVFLEDSFKKYQLEFYHQNDVYNKLRDVLKIENQYEYLGLPLTNSITGLLSVMIVFQTKWMIIKDVNNYANVIMDKIVNKKFIYASSESKMLHKYIYDSIISCSILILYGFNGLTNNKLISTLYHNRGKTLSLHPSLTKILIPMEFQIIFIVEDLPESPMFDSVLIDISDIGSVFFNTIFKKLFETMYSEKAHSLRNLSEEISNSNTNIIKMRNEISITFIKSSELLIFHNIDAIKMYQLYKPTISLLETQIARANQEKKQILADFMFFENHVKEFCSLFDPHKVIGGFPRFILELSFVIGHYTITYGTLESIESILSKFSSRINAIKVMGLDSFEKIRFYQQFYHLETQNVKEIFEILSSFDSSIDMMHFPISINELLSATSCRRPVFVDYNHYIVRSITQRKHFLCCFNEVPSLFNEYKGQKVFLIVLLINSDHVTYLNDVIPRMNDINSIHEEFRLFLLGPSDIDFTVLSTPLRLLIDHIKLFNLNNMKQRVTFLSSSSSKQLLDSQFLFNSHKRHRFIFLLSIFHSSIEMFIRNITHCNINIDDSFYLLQSLILSSPEMTIKEIRNRFLLPSYYVNLPNHDQTILDFWDRIFHSSHFENAPIKMFNLYPIPYIYNINDVSEYTHKFPYIDNAFIFGFPEKTFDFYYQNISNMHMKSNFISFIDEDRSNSINQAIYRFAIQEKVSIDDIQLLLTSQKSSIYLPTIIIINGVFNQDKVEYQPGYSIISNIYLTPIPKDTNRKSILMYYDNSHCIPICIDYDHAFPFNKVFCIWK